MGTAVLLVAVLASPTAFFGAVLGLGRLLRWRRARRPAPPPSRPIERVGRDLRRLRDALAEVENAPADLPGKHARCQATRAAYLDVLTDACAQLEIPAPACRPVSDAEIWRIEGDLRRRGLDVRSVA